MSDVPRAEKETYRYRIDGDNVIIGVSDNWLSFAEKNGGDGRCHPNRVVGMSLLDFVQDMETVHLYEIIIEKVRKTGKPAKFPFRCDSPGMRRFMELVVIPREGGGVELASRAIRTEPRPLSVCWKMMRRGPKISSVSAACARKWPFRRTDGSKRRKP